MENEDREVAKEMDKYYKKAKSIIVENREFFDVLVEKLIKYKTLTYRSIASIRKKMELKADL